MRKITPAAAGAVAFAGALALDLLTKTYFVAHADGPRAIVYNHRPHNLAVRIDVSLLTIAIVYLLAVAARRRGLGRLWGAWICVGILVGGTLGNGASSYLWAEGVPDFIRVSGGWVWNVADFEIVVGLLGTAGSILANAVLEYARTRRRNAIAAPANPSS